MTDDSGSVSGGLPLLSRRRLPWLAVAVVAILGLAAVLIFRDSGGDESATKGTTSTTTTTTTAPPPPPVFPLTGILGEPPQQAGLAVKIDNSEKGRPPVGILQADIVVEEVVEGGLTRLMAIFQSQDPETVGPVRSARSTDVSLLAELGRPLFAWSGANANFGAMILNANLVDVGAEAAAGSYWRDSDRSMPTNLFSSPAQLRAAGAGFDGTAAATPPPQMFQYREPGTPLTGAGVVPAAGYHTVRTAELTTGVAWDWDAAGGKFVRSQNGTPHLDVAGHGVTADNVLIRGTPYIDSGERDSVGAVVPEAQTVGEGDCTLLSSGAAQPCHWSKPSIDAPTTYTGADGAPLKLLPGNTWLEVLPPGTGTLV